MCYAWPVELGVTGNRAFFINQGGDILSSNMSVETYEPGSQPMAGLSGYCFDQGVSRTAANTVDQRGNTWVVI